MSATRRIVITVLIMLTLVYSTAWHALFFMPESSYNLDVRTLWQQSSVDGDAAYYLRQTENIDDSIGPYKYRVLPTLFVRAIMALMHIPPIGAYLVFNALCMVASGTGFTLYLMQMCRFRYAVALLGGVLAVATVSMQSMMLLPMDEPASYVAALAVVWTLHARKALPFVLVVTLAVMVKEVFIVAVPIWIALEVCDCLAARAGADHRAPGAGR